MRPYTILSLSGGKDSTALLLMCLEKKEQIDEVITCDTGLEFPEMYDHLSKLKKIINDNGIKYTVLKSKESFDYMMLEKPIKSDKYGDHVGLGWPSPNARWCTKYLKTELIKNFLKELEIEKGEIIQLIGLASDESKRLAREFNKSKNKRYPLNEWGITEKDALNYCYTHGFDWGGLYEKFKRVSCWCCPLQSMDSLRALYWEYPILWRQLEKWEYKQQHDNAGRGGLFWFKDQITVFDLSARFAIEKKRQMLYLDVERALKISKQTFKELPKSQTTIDKIILDGGQ